MPEIVESNAVKVKSNHLEFEEIKTPQMVALVCGVGTGSKVLQAMLDSHEQIYMIPAYPLMYFYPHWQTWKHDLAADWTWHSIIDIFCIKHASVLDSRKISGHNGLTSLGENHNLHIEIDENLFRRTLGELLKNQPVKSSTFLLAVHYAYAICKNQDLAQKKILLYHIHIVDYLTDYLLKDFPNTKTLAMLRDQRSNLERRVTTAWNVDDAKLNKSDALIYRGRAYYQVCSRILNDLNHLAVLNRDAVRLIKHEDLYYLPEAIMRSVSDFLEIDHLPGNLEITFDGKKWGGDKVYNMPHINKVNPRVVSLCWQQSIGKIEWFLLEGVLFDYFKQYGYTLYKYSNDTILRRLLLLILMMFPTRFEWRVFFKQIKPLNHLAFIRACRQEADGKVELKNYTWNATHLYKWTYLDLELWRPRWYRQILVNRQTPSAGSGKRLTIFLSKFIYLTVNYLRYLWSIFSYPGLVTKRSGLFYKYFFRRVRRRNIFPSMVQFQIPNYNSQKNSK